MSRRAVLFIALSLLAPGSAKATDEWRPEGAKLSCYATPTRVTVGERILYLLDCIVPEGVEVTLPAFGQTLGDFRIRDLGAGPAEKPRRGMTRISRLYDLRLYETGSRVIPAVTVTLKDREGHIARMDGGAIAVVVDSVLDKEPKDIKDIKQPREIPRSLRGILIFALLLAAAAAGIAVMARKISRRGGIAPSSPPAPPHIVAYESLERLLAMNLLGRGLVKEYYTALSDIVRRYIERRFGLRAPDRTTEEFLAEAAVSGLLNSRARSLVGDFLSTCDMVKFARYGPTDSENSESYRAAKRFVDETAPKEME